MSHMPHRLAQHAGDALSAVSAVGFGATILSDLELIVSILAGLAVCVSACLSIYLNWRDRVNNKKNDDDSE